MQTSLAVREAVMKLLDVMVYIIVYFTTMLVIIMSADVRLVIPMLVWFVIYGIIHPLTGIIPTLNGSLNNPQKSL